MSDRAGADDVLSQVGTVGAVASLTADHTGVMFCGDLDAAQMVVLMCQAGVRLGAFFRFQERLEWYIEPSGFRHRLLF